ncbi:ankyrin repeat domain-containing protein [Sphingomonas glaciei]|uniref:Ankyrin repeat domain-containing protein n=1 Tax=Sphingomonas glaciei TaxID=2938948 RepID=A0ABY5MS12_9SPHN|nr:ankyrin repeat domain-containing protein [Sphingomonas glaciei]UUR07285.1 ankyrin repeat domain-containing protein [Sphingomonas glaciei]
MSKRRAAIGALLLACLAMPVSAQTTQSPGYSFLQAVRERDGNKATELVQQPGSTVLNYRDDRGESALHIVTGQRDLTWLRFLTGQGADVNIVNRNGDTPLLAAARIGFAEGADFLISRGAQVDRPNRRGETPLIIAVQQRNIALVKLLAERGANPDRTDNATGRSARDYARMDSRGPEMLRVMDMAKAAKKPEIIAGPKL